MVQQGVVGERPTRKRGSRAWIGYLPFALVILAAAGFVVSKHIGHSSFSIRVLPAATVQANAQSEFIVDGGASSCSPTTVAAHSGGSPASLESGGVELADGTIEGAPWSLWGTKGQTGATALEDGGVVWNGKEYGLCSGYSDPTVTEVIATNGDAIIYGVVGLGGPSNVQVYEGHNGTFATGAQLPSPNLALIDGVTFYIGTLPHSACRYSFLEVNTTPPNTSLENDIGFGPASGPTNPKNIGGGGGACVPGHLDPEGYNQSSL